MFRLLLKLLVLPPELLKVHAQGYADLASQVWTQHLRTLQSRWMMYALSALTLLLALILGGTAFLLWSVMPHNEMRHAWVLLALPLSLLGLSGLCWVRARSLRTRPVMNDIQEQLQLDMLAIRQAQTP